MTNNLFALLVGIDNYPSPVTSLKGCVNDVTAIEEYLRGRMTKEDDRLHLMLLKDQQATRTAVIEGFQQHLGQAGRNDIVFFAYSGHGSQEHAPLEFWHLEPDRLNETLVCWDSRIGNGWDLADKELAKLIADLAKNSPRICILLDCCHSGTGTREDLREAAVRRAPTDRRNRPLNSYIVSPEAATSLITSRSIDIQQSGWDLPRGRHILLAACRDQETAKEYRIEGKHRGAFSYFVMETLRKASGNLTHRDLFKQANALVRSNVSAQSPQLEATHSEDLDQHFLGEAIAEPSSYFTIYHHRDYGWVMDGGAVHGIPCREEGETTRLVVFPFDSTPEQLRQLSAAVAQACVTEVLPHLSQVEIVGVETLNTNVTFKAVVTMLPLPPLKVWIEGEEMGVATAHQALSKASPDRQPSLYVCEVKQPLEAEFRVLAHNRQYKVFRSQDAQSLGAPINGYTPSSALQVVQRLEHVARWISIVKLAGSITSQIRSDAVRLQVYQDDREIEAAQIFLKYQWQAERWQAPAFQIKITNTSDQALYCTVLNLTELYAVRVNLFEAGGVWLQPGEEAWALGGRLLYAQLPQKLWDQGIIEYRDILKLIVCTAEFDARLLAQENLDMAQQRTVHVRHAQPRFLDRLMRQMQQRDISDRPEGGERLDDWMTNQVMLTTIRPTEELEDFS